MKPTEKSLFFYFFFALKPQVIALPGAELLCTNKFSTFISLGQIIMTLTVVQRHRDAHVSGG